MYHGYSEKIPFCSHNWLYQYTISLRTHALNPMMASLFKPMRPQSIVSKSLYNENVCYGQKRFGITWTKQMGSPHQKGIEAGWRIYASVNHTIICSDNAGILLIRTLGTNFSEILIEIHTFWFMKMHLKMSSAKWWPYCLGLDVLNAWKHV